MAYITVYYIDFDTKEVISTYDYSLNVGQTQNINVQDHIPAGYLDLFTYNNGNFVYDNSIQVVADEPLYVNGQTGDRFTNNVLCFVSATWDGSSELSIDDLSDLIDLVSIIPTHTSEIAPVDIVDNISITENAMSGQFLTIGDISYPTCSVSLFRGEYTTATVFLKGSEFYIVAQMFGVYQILGKFTVTSEPTIDTDIISLEGSGVLASEGINSVVDLADVMTSERINEILQVQPSLDHIIPASLNNMSYYWYFIVEDIFNLFGIPLIIDRWDYCREDFIASNNIMELLLPSVTVSTSADSDGNMVTSTEEEKAITWKDILTNIALLLNCNVVEHGGAIHLKHLPGMSSKSQLLTVSSDIYDGNSRFSNNKYWFKSAKIKYREYGIRADSDTNEPVNAVFWGNDTRSHTAFTGVPSIWNAGSVEYTTNVNCAYLEPYIWRNLYTNKQIITLLGNKARAKSLYRSFDIDEDITWEGLDVFNGVPDVVYEPADISFLGWNPLMSIGNCFYCKDYDGNNRIIYVGTKNVTYSGGITVSVSATCNLEDGTSSEYTTSEISSTATGGIANIQSIVNQMLEGVLIRDNALNGTKITDATITGGKITDATITGGKIANSTITSTQIADSTITNAKIANSTITGSKIVDGTLDGSTKIANATISYAKIDSSFVGSLVADSAFVTELQAEIASFGYITAQEADLDYAQIDFANVANGAIKSALIQDGAITDAKIGGVSANKLTAGTIDASNITVTNLNATNITTGRITVDGITIDVANNEASIDGGYIEDGTITMNGFSSDVVARIDGAIETFTCNDIPTLQNYPASTWTSSDYDKHVGDVAYVVNPSSTADGYTYRFTKSSDNQYSWVLIKDTDITKALQDILDLQGDVDAIERFDSTVSSFMIDTDDEIKSLKVRTSSLETTMGTKVDTSTFNELSQTVDENKSSITSLSQTVSGKADSSTVSTLSNTVNTISQKTDANISSISSLITTVSGKADASNVYTKTETDSRIAVVQQDLTGFKTTVSNTYTTKTEFNNLEIGGKNLFRNSGFLGITTLPNDDSDTTFKTNWVRGYNNSLCSFTSFADGVNQAEVTLNNSINLGICFGRLASDMDLDSSSYYTLSCWAKCTKANAKLAIGLSYYNTLNDFVWRGGTNQKAFDATDTWQKFTLTFKPDADTKGILYCFTCDNGVNGGTDKLYIRQCKLEKGNRATDWTPAPEDTDDQMSALTQRVTIAESSIEQNATNITTKVSKTDFTGQNVMSMINQDASSVTISASKVNLDGYVNITNSSGNRNLFRLKDSVPGYFEHNTASIFPQTASKERTTDYIPVTAGDDYTLQAWNDTTNPVGSWGEWICVNVYDSNKNYILQPICEYIPSANYKKYTLNIPPNGAYVRISSNWVDKGYEYAKVKLEKGTIATPWTLAPEDEVNSSDIYSANTTTIDGGKITTGSIVADKITVGDLSDLSDDMGTITAGVLKSHNYVADTSGMKLTLSDGVWDSKDFKISSTGAITSTAGTIGGWTIGNNTLTSSVPAGTETTKTATISSSDTSLYLGWYEGMGTSAHSKLEYSQLNIHYNSLIMHRDAYYTDRKAEIEYRYSSSKHYLCEYGINFTNSDDLFSADSALLTLTDVNGGVTISAKTNDGIVITNNSSNVFRVSTAGAVTATGLITAKNGVDSWGKLEGNTLKINNTGASSFAIEGGGSIGGTLAVGGNITSNNKNVVVDNYASGFMAFTNDSASANTVKSSTSVRYNLASVTLTPGVYIIECMAEWRSNSTSGYRDICLSTSSNGGKIDKYCESTVAPSSAYDRQIFTYTTHITSNTTFYLTAQQNSGDDISTLGGIRALRIGNN